MCVYNNSVKTFGIRNISGMEPGETRYADGVLSRKINSLRRTGKTIEKSSQPRLCAVFFLIKLRQVEE